MIGADLRQRRLLCVAANNQRARKVVDDDCGDFWRFYLLPA